MGLLFGGLFKREAARQASVPASTLGSQNEGTSVVTGDWKESVVSPFGRRSLLVPAWCRGVSLIMQTMGQMRIQYQRKSADGFNFVEDNYGDARRLNWMMQVRPNPLMSASQLQEQIEFRKIFYGNAFVYVERNVAGWPVALWLCNNGSYNGMANSYTLTYNRNGVPVVLTDVDAHDVLHFKNTFLTEDFTMGIPTISYAMKTLSIAATADDQTLRDLAKGGKHKVILQEEKSPTLGTRGRANRSELERMKEQFASDWNSGDFILFDNVADFMEDDAVLIISGIIDLRKDDVLNSAASHGFTVVEENYKDNWCAFTLIK